MIAAVVTITLLALLLAGVPVGFALALAGLLGVTWGVGAQAALSLLATTPLTTTNGYELIAVPLFILMAEFVVVSGVADRMFHAMSIWGGGCRAAWPSPRRSPARASARFRGPARRRRPRSPRPRCRRCGGRATR